MYAALPKTIWMLWLQGWDAAPPLVQACRTTWERRNPGWEVVPLTRDTLPQYLDVGEAFAAGDEERIPAAAFSDLVRVALLRDRGGVWADSTVFCVKPLEAWLPRHLEAGFFAFAGPGGGRMISSWFLAATPQHPVTQTWFELCARYWENRSEPDEYYWFHYLFADAYEQDERFRASWDAVPKLSAHGPHRFVPYEPRLLRAMTPRVRARVEAGIDPVYKLSTHADLARADRRSAYRFLVDRAQAGVASERPLTPWRRSLVLLDSAAEGVRWRYRDSRRLSL